MRGKETPLASDELIAGITPACAGKRTEHWQYKTSRRDHPRACGEKVRAYVKIWNEWGSPPRVRGKAGLFLSHCLPPWITPAYAGKSANTIADMPGDWDHPRVCGEKPKFELDKLNSVGSPPRMRGKDLVLRSKHLEIGITPACAGKSVRRITNRCRGAGLPPHVQGKVADTLCAMSLMGITPAYAGKSRFPSSTAPYRRDHPRVCGEKSCVK